MEKFEQQTITKEQVIEALENIKSVEDSKFAAEKLLAFLETIDISKLSRADKLKVQGVINHCKKPDAEIDNGQRYIELINRIVD